MLTRLPLWRLNRKQTLVFVVIIGALGTLLIFIGGYYMDWTWTGLGSYFLPKNATNDFHPAKTLWDWLQLLIVPAVLASGAFLLNRLNTETQNKITEENQREAALQTYIDKMSELLLNKGLRESKEDTEIRNVVRTRTLTLLRRLDRDRKTILLEFLTNAKLVSRSDRSQSETIIISLRGANLGGVDLREANLHGANLSSADLSRTDLYGADLRGANLISADLHAANLGFANLSNADLHGANLGLANMSNANLSFAKLLGADLHSANLHGANLSLAKLRGANLHGADLRGAEINDEQLDGVKSLRGTIMRDGSKHP